MKKEFLIAQANVPEGATDISCKISKGKIVMTFKKKYYNSDKPSFRHLDLMDSSLNSCNGCESVIETVVKDGEVFVYTFDPKEVITEKITPLVKAMYLPGEKEAHKIRMSLYWALSMSLEYLKTSWKGKKAVIMSSKGKAYSLRSVKDMILSKDEVVRKQIDQFLNSEIEIVLQ